MALSKDARSCVVFIGTQSGQEGSARIKPFGTAFFFQGGRHLKGGSYLVTAGHVARKLINGPWVLRMNKRGGGARLIEVNRAEDVIWHYHTDETVDLAVTPMAVPEWADVIPFTADHSLHPFKMKSKRIDAGDLAFVVGLFHLLHGKEENRPIVHSGHIAMLPGEERIPITGQDGKTIEVEGYLVQTNAISGCSGSPVFAVRSLDVRVPPSMFKDPETQGDKPLSGEIPGSLWLLGVWQSSWKVKGSQIVAARTDSEESTGWMAPLGMGVVVPITKLFEILDMPELKATREASSR
jgi:hypothetical protein